MQLEKLKRQEINRLHLVMRLKEILRDGGQSFAFLVQINRINFISSIARLTEN